MVLYYHLPETYADSTELTLEIHDTQGNLVRKLSSKRNPDFQSYAGGPSPEPTLSTRKGINRFVWDLRYPTVPGIPTAYIESSYRGHKAIPGTYNIKLRIRDVVLEAIGEIQDIPGSKLTPSDFQAYHQWMSTLEGEVTQMHNLVNKAKKYQDQLQELIGKLANKVEYKDLKLSAQNLVKELAAWDESMVQRKSTAYDDVENFPNKFTANFIFMMIHGEGSIKCIIEGTKVRHAEFLEEWKPLEAEGKRLVEQAIPTFNALAKETGVGVLFLK